MALARATISCRRCHRRKKRCDRSLPQCQTCCHAQTPCSFLDDDRQVGTYPIVYVQRLESRVKELEQHLAAAVTGTASASPTHPADELAATGTVDFTSPPTIDPAVTGLSVPGQPSGRPDSLVDELKSLSLEAAAERHLGSSSGLSFAKLTQAVLRRLSPDKAEFVFEGDLEPSSQDAENFVADEFPSLSGLSSWSDSLLCTPSLFSDIPISLENEDDTLLADLRLPDESRTNHLLEFYFAHSHTLYPIIRRSEFCSGIWRVYSDPLNPLAQSPLWLFRIWMVLAIGSTTHCSVTLAEESESVLYYNKAMVYFEQALSYGDMAALEVLMLQVSYSFFNQVGPNTWFLIGVAARMAIGMGLHTASTYIQLPTDMAEYRKRIFFSVYMMDRVVSMALGRPFAMQDDDIDVIPFADVDDENLRPESIIPQDSLQPSSMAIPLHILALRRIASEISTQVYSSRKSHLSSAERENIIQAIHRKLVEWRRNMPFPLPDVHSRVPHLSSSWFDLNYYTHIAMLYRPSPLFPTLDPTKVKVLATAASMSIRQAINMHRQQRFAYNWLNLLGVFTSTLSLMYATTAQPDNLAMVVAKSKAVEDLNLSVELLETFSQKFPAASKIKRMVQEVMARFAAVCDDSTI